MEMRNYERAGLTIQRAMVEQEKELVRSDDRPSYLLWGAFKVQTSDRIDVPEHGVVRVEFLSCRGSVRQGFDVQVDGGAIILPDGSAIDTLRTWRDPRYEDTVEYPYRGPGVLRVWNVYEMSYPSGEVRPEHWTENAGFWVEQSARNARTYHCSPGQAYPPDFESLVVRLSWHTGDPHPGLE